MAPPARGDGKRHGPSAPTGLPNAVAPLPKIGVVSPVGATTFMLSADPPARYRLSDHPLRGCQARPVW
jgi:hypothetical protein